MVALTYLAILAALPPSETTAEKPAEPTWFSANTSLASVDYSGKEVAWSSLGMALSAPINPDLRLDLSVDHESRDGVKDTKYAAELERRIGKNATLRVSAAATPSADYKAKWQTGLGFNYAIKRSIQTSLNVRLAQYANTQTLAVEPAIRYAVRGDKLAFQIRSINILNGTHKLRSGGALRVESEVSDNIRLMAGIARYPETEGGITRQTRSAYAGTAIALSDQLRVWITLDHELRISSYNRRGASLSLSWRL